MWEKRNIPDDFYNGVRSNQGDDQDWHFVNAGDIHLGKAQNGAMTSHRSGTCHFRIVPCSSGMAVEPMNLYGARKGPSSVAV
jgi:hypothetical protein